MRNVGRGVENGVDAVADVCANHNAVLALGVLLDCVAEVAEQGPRLDQLDGLLQTFACRLGNAHGIRVSACLVADIVRLVQVAMIALMVESDIKVDNVAVLKWASIRNAVADDLVNGCADGLWKMVVV